MPTQDEKSVRTWGQPVLYRNTYIWFMVLSACDVLLTWTILQAGGVEMNPLAKDVIEQFGTQGIVIYKFLMVTVVICLCEAIGQKHHRIGRWVATLGVCLTTVPVAWSFITLVYGR